MYGKREQLPQLIESFSRRRNLKADLKTSISSKSAKKFCHKKSHKESKRIFEMFSKGLDDLP